MRRNNNLQTPRRVSTTITYNETLLDTKYLHEQALEEIYISHTYPSHEKNTSILVLF